ncbi:MAG: addiction module protein [Planctomycetes bacterium]|jgi:putative addiction module component (TIGR02574 family)|nr:addiction module protein [Planctomycetota bacterium]
MTKTAAVLHQKALRLSAEERADLLIALWESMSSDSDEISAGELAFAKQRFEEHKATPNKVVPWRKVRSELRAKSR